MGQDRLKHEQRRNRFQDIGKPEEATVENWFVVVSARSRYDLNNLLAYGLAELLGGVGIEEKRALALAIVPVLQCRNADEIATLLRRQGVPCEASP